MSGVVSGSNYGGYNGGHSSGGGINSKYGSIDNKSYQSGGYGTTSASYNEGGLGTYGDYTYSKSTLDKYKDKNVPIKKLNTSVGGSGTNITTPLVEEKKEQPIIDNKKPF
jgi:hypothetical protein